ncbi:MAG: GumC family protein [Armatimonadota bacterium]
MDQETEQLDLRHVLRVLWRRRWVIVGCTAGVTALVVLCTWLQKPVYEARALLLIASNSAQIRGTDEMPILGTVLEGASGSSVETHKRLVKTRPVLQEAIEELGLDETPSELAQRIEVTSDRGTDVLEIKARDTHPARAAAIANSVASHYVEQSQSYSREAARRARDFLETQIERVRNELWDAEEELEKFKRDHGIADLSAETTAVIQRVAMMEGLRAEAEADARAAEAKAASTRRELARQPAVEQFSKTVQKNPVVARLEQTLVDLEVERAGLLEDYNEAAPQVVAVDARIRRTREALADQVETVVASSEERISPMHQSLLVSAVKQEADARGARQRERSLAHAVERLTARLEGLPAKEAELARLTRAKTVSDSVYTLLLEKSHEVRLAESMQLSNARVWETAAAPAHPILPRRRLNTAVGLAFGLIAGLLLAAAIEYLDDTVKGPDDAKRALGMPVMGVVPLVRDLDDRLLHDTSGRSGLAEAYRLIRSNVTFSSVDKPFKTLMITSASALEGKSTTCVNLGIIMAQQETKVVLVDTDLRRPVLHKMLDVHNGRGLTNALVGETSLADVVQETQFPNLSLVPAGPIPPNPAELLSTRRAEQVLKELRELGDVIIFDSPPSGVVADAAILGARLDGTLLVIEQDTTRRPAALQAKERLEAARASLVGTILNKAVARPGEYHYYYYYYDRYYGDRERDA